MYEWTVVVGFILGAFVGSFLNVVIYRLPRGISLVQPRSHCPHCQHSLGLVDLIPLGSYLFYGRKCRYCGVPISSRYFWVELITASLWAGFWWQNLVVGWEPVRFIVMVIFSGILVACIFIDLTFYLLPDALNGLLLACGVLYNIYLGFTSDSRSVVWLGNYPLPSAAAGACLGAGIFWVIAIVGRVVFRQDALGHGDIKLARGIGAVLFPGGALISFGLAVCLGAVLGALQVLARRLGESGEGGEVSPPEPESLGSLLKCGLGYLLWIDAVGILLPRLERWWFGEGSSEEVTDDWQPTLSTIPFGPYLAIGGLFTALWEPSLMGYVEAYWDWVTGGT